ncbi:hypothetical protein C8R45DRAFT_368442 [Mycena sanguinolenta]|nr:hypothetical protein C8R45DRAFT_368442 [Mycena sanguinolenta]
MKKTRDGDDVAAGKKGPNWCGFAGGGGSFELMSYAERPVAIAHTKQGVLIAAQHRKKTPYRLAGYVVSSLNTTGVNFIKTMTDVECVCLGAGMSTLILSLLPSRILNIIELFGYSAERVLALELLGRVGGWGAHSDSTEDVASSIGTAQEGDLRHGTALHTRSTAWKPRWLRGLWARIRSSILKVCAFCEFDASLVVIFETPRPSRRAEGQVSWLCETFPGDTHP